MSDVSGLLWSIKHRCGYHYVCKVGEIVFTLSQVFFVQYVRSLTVFPLQLFHGWQSEQSGGFPKNASAGHTDRADHESHQGQFHFYIAKHYKIPHVIMVCIYEFLSFIGFHLFPFLLFRTF